LLLFSITENRESGEWEFESLRACSKGRILALATPKFQILNRL
jgi:hypothetical protein